MAAFATAVPTLPIGFDTRTKPRKVPGSLFDIWFSINTVSLVQPRRIAETFAGPVNPIVWPFLVAMRWCRDGRSETQRSLLFQFAELLSLLCPISFDGNRADVAFGEWCTALGVGWKVEELFLDVRGEAGEAEDLSEASSGDLTGPGKVGLGLESAG